MLVKNQNGFVDSRKQGSGASKLFVSGDPSLLIKDCPESGRQSYGRNGPKRIHRHVADARSECKVDLGV